MNLRSAAAFQEADVHSYTASHGSSAPRRVNTAIFGAARFPLFWRENLQTTRLQKRILIFRISGRDEAAAEDYVGLRARAVDRMCICNL